MWNAQPVIFEDEDEEKLKADFIRLCALYPSQDIFEIASYVFRHQRDPEMRSQQAGMIWSKDIEIQERIRLARLNGGKEAAPIPDKAARLQMLQTIFEDESQAAKDRLAAARLISEIQGEIVKAVDKKIDHGKRPPRQIVFAQYAD
jgi:hypothetical protein